MSNQVYLSLGSNLGDRVGCLAEAVRRLEGAGLRALRASSVYETAPQGLLAQPSFLNLAVTAETDLPPEALLTQIQAVENGLGRVRTERWGPRTIDIDLLLYGADRLSTPRLEIPHPRMTERAFVLIPLLELNPDLALPSGGEGPSVLLNRCLDTLPDQGVSLFMRADPFLQLVRGVQ